ncbi:MAG: PspA/IM30 family protein [Chloroflexota bacterium]
MNDNWSAGERALRTAVRPLAARLTWRRRWRWALAAAGWSVCGSAAVMLAARFLPIDPAWFYAALCPVGGFVLAWLAALVAPVSPERVAAGGDALGLRERLITAWELRNDDGPAALIQRQDALDQLRRLDLKASIRLRFDRRSLRVPAAALALAMVLGVWPSAMSGVIAARRAERAAIKREQAKIAEMRKELASATRPLSETEQQILAALREAQRRLAKSGTAREAVKQLADLEQQLDALKQPDKATGTSLKQMAAALSGSEATRAAAEALQQGDYRRAADALSQLGRSLSGSDAMSAAAALERASRTPGLDPATAAALRNAAQALAQAGQLAAAQGDAAQATQAAIAAAQASLSDAGEQLAAAGQSASEQAALASVANALAAARGNISASASAAGGNLPGSMVAAGGQSGSGQGGSGQGGSGQSGSGTGSQAGQGSGSSGAGHGSTNQAQQGGQAPQGGQTTGSGAPGMQRGEYERIYDPTRLGGDGQTSTLPGQTGEGPSQYIDAPNLPGGPETLLPYDEVLAAYSQEAREALAGSSIPPALQSLVKDYFLSLEPSR